MGKFSLLVSVTLLALVGCGATPSGNGGVGAPVKITDIQHACKALSVEEVSSKMGFNDLKLIDLSYQSYRPDLHECGYLNYAPNDPAGNAYNNHGLTITVRPFNQREWTGIVSGKSSKKVDFQGYEIYESGYATVGTAIIRHNDTTIVQFNSLVDKPFGDTHRQALRELAVVFMSRLALP